MGRAQGWQWNRSTAVLAQEAAITSSWAAEALLAAVASVLLKFPAASFSTLGPEGKGLKSEKEE